MKIRFSPAAFSVVFCVGYATFFWTSRPLFRYFPVPHQWVWGASDTITRPGPAMVWYGLVATTGLTALLAALIVPEAWIVSKMRGWLWVWPVATAGVCAYLLRIFFL